MNTSIQVKQETKNRLEKLKSKTKQTYDQIVSELLRYEEKLLLKEQIKEYYQSYKEQDLQDVNEWKYTEEKE